MDDHPDVGHARVFIPKRPSGLLCARCLEAPKPKTLESNSDDWRRCDCCGVLMKRRTRRASARLMGKKGMRDPSAHARAFTGVHVDEEGGATLRRDLAGAQHRRPRNRRELAEWQAAAALEAEKAAATRAAEAEEEEA